MEQVPDELGERLARHEGRLRGLVVHLAGQAVRRRVEVEDLVQEVWLRCLRRTDLPPPPGPDVAADPELWAVLAATARRVVVDAARAIRAARRDGRLVRLERSDWSREPGSAAPSGLASPGPGPATRVAGRELSERLLRAFERLPPEHRRVIGLRRFEGLSAREAGARMGRSEAAVHSLYRRALEAWQAASGRP